MISPSGREIDIGQTMKAEEYIGMCRREVLDGYLRDRAVEYGAQPINGLVQEVILPSSADGKYTIKYANYAGDQKVGTPEQLEVDVVIGADGANSRVAKAIDAGEYNFAIAFQERIKISEQQMEFYEELAEMYVGDDVSPDFYGWVFPKYDHVGVGTGTVINRPGIKDYQKAIRERAGPKIEGGKIIKVEAHPIPEHMRPRRVVGGAAGYVTKCSGEGIYFAAKSGRMAAEAIVKLSKSGTVLPTQSEIEDAYLAPYDRLYGPTYAVLDVLQQLFYRSNPAREAFVEMCASEYVQQVTFDSYLYKKVTSGGPLADIKLLVDTVGNIMYQNSRTDVPKDRTFSNPVESLARLGSK